MNHKKAARLAAIKAHNERHERELTERGSDALFRYIWRLCGGKRKRRSRMAVSALAMAGAYGNVQPYYASPEDTI